MGAHHLMGQGSASLGSVLVISEDRSDAAGHHH